MEHLTSADSAHNSEKPIDCFISVIALLDNDADILEAYVRETTTLLAQKYAHYELVLIDDGSTDDTDARIGPLLELIDGMRYVRLAARYGEESAISAGLDTVIGDYVVIMLPDSDPVTMIPLMIEQAMNGCGVVFGIAEKSARMNVSRRVSEKIFYWYCNSFLKLRLPKNGTIFRVLSRKAVNALLRIRSSHRYIRLLSAYTGFARDEFSYEKIGRRGTPRVRGFRESLVLGLNIIMAQTIRPLRFVSLLGLAASAINLAYLGYIVTVYLFKPDVAAGWTTLSLQMSGMFFFVFLTLALMAEYIGKLMLEVKEAPRYHVLEEKCSSVLMDERVHRNIVHQSQWNLREKSQRTR